MTIFTHSCVSQIENLNFKSKFCQILTTCHEINGICILEKKERKKNTLLLNSFELRVSTYFVPHS